MLDSDVLKLVFAVSRTFVNILGDNFVVFGISSIAFWVIGWVIMFGGWKWPLGLTS
jgi:ammonia channel protein AmtB